MTISTSTNSPDTWIGSILEPGAVPEWEADAAAPHDTALLRQIANALFAAVPGSPVGAVEPPLAAAPAAPPQSPPGTPLPTPPSEAALRSIPAALAGAIGVSPRVLQEPLEPESTGSAFYFLESARPSSPQAVPNLNVVPPGFEPPLGFTVPTVWLAADPRSAPGRSAPPGLRLGSTAPVTPGVEVGALPVAGAIPPASAFGANRDVTSLPVSSELDGLNGISLGQSLAPAGSPLTAGGEGSEASLYFLGETLALGGGSGFPEAELDEGVPALVAGETSAHPGFDVYAVRRDFPILQEKVHGYPLVWLDNGATTQKPQAVIDRLVYFYRHENSNIHRAAHELAARSTDAYEGARDKVARFLHASSKDEIVFTRGTTEAINLVAQSWGRRYIGKGDEIIITWLEHHANIVPWQQLCAETGAQLKVAPVDDRGQILLDEYEKLFTPRTRLAAFTQVSNALGTVTPAREMIEIAHRHGARVLLDGAQGIAHMPVDVQALDCDWYVFSGHKIFSPTGIGALYGKLELLDATPPWQGGGNMIQDVTHERTIYHAAPHRFEAGTGNIADAVGLGAALDYVERLGRENLERHEQEILAYATEGLSTVPGLRIIGTAAEKAGVISFVLPGFRTEDVGKALNRQGIAVRAGHHCAQPILRRFGLETTVRPSFALYNTREDVDALVAAVRRIQAGSVELGR
ncbi:MULTISPECIES: family 2A encapsulin nanocompartment cargo protein cysteine desulfurase [unclassified Methylococcus]|uniref:family 2A encapsulin nanocompartment cargo protein cysteine desulfurase n=1 Tax=unclassified Methylococcus TaxID=2618889 RepID=UPI003D7E50B2